MSIGSATNRPEAAADMAHPAAGSASIQSPPVGDAVSDLSALQLTRVLGNLFGYASRAGD